MFCWWLCPLMTLDSHSHSETVVVRQPVIVAPPPVMASKRGKHVVRSMNGCSAATIPWSGLVRGRFLFGNKSFVKQELKIAISYSALLYH